MAEQGLVARRKRRRRGTTKPDRSARKAPDGLRRRLAQARGRKALSWPQRMELDLEYVQAESFWLDLMTWSRGLWCSRDRAWIVTREMIRSVRRDPEAVEGFLC